VRRGLGAPVVDSQEIFRAVLEAMGRPGRIVDVRVPDEVPSTLHPATGAICLALADLETPVWLDRGVRTGEVMEYLRFHCGVPFVSDPAAARFAVVAEPMTMLPLAAFHVGTDEEPAQSTTVIIQVASLEPGDGCRLTGPGIAADRRLGVVGVPAAFWPQLRDNHAAFPRGVDVVLVAGSRIAALPRTVRPEI
jgi:alpha-D-ribose 1-methylphosphonate 5-triphosphate synthase subunit PhnH